MILIELLHYLREHSIRLTAHGKQGKHIAVEASQGVITPEVVAALKTYRRRLLKDFVPFPYWRQEGEESLQAVKVSWEDSVAAKFPPEELGEPCPECGSKEKWIWLDSRRLCCRCLIRGDLPRDVGAAPAN
jgi:hypothetical protein